MVKFLLIALLALTCSVKAHDFFYTNDSLFSTLTDEKKQEIELLQALLTDELVEGDYDACLHVIKEMVDSGKFIRLADNSLWQVNWRTKDREIAQRWLPEERVKITAKNDTANSFLFENIQRKESILTNLEQKPENHLSHYILRLSNSVFDADNETKVILENGLIFKGPRTAWGVRDHIFILNNPTTGFYDIWNITKNKTVAKWKLVGNERTGSSESIFNIEKRLNQRVLGQKGVIQKISASLFNCWSGLQDPELPLGVFLFLGPSGVGKTELAKALAKELYKESRHFIRFDMSQFVEACDYTRLIGSPPGYVNHEEGGQLTEAIKAEPQSVVLLDEIEKAHPSIRKAFLSIFDEGYITDSKNTKVKCNRVIFIMTANIGSEEIAKLFNRGYEADDVMKTVEPAVISYLSPEFYNRLIPLVFRPITADIMEDLVEQKLGEIVERLKKLKQIALVIDRSVNDYLITHGFHPHLGARPLKRLIEKNIVANIAYAIIAEGIPNGSTLTLSYVTEEDSWKIDWSLPTN